MAIQLTVFLIIFLNITCIGVMLYKLKHAPATLVSKTDYIKLMFSGVLAFISDTIGVGSFAVNIALAKLFGTFRDGELPAMCNGAQIIPGAIASLLFIKMVNVELTTLIPLVAGTCLGGLIGGSIISRLSQQAIRFTMICCFALIIGLLIGEKLNLFPMDGTITELHHFKLVLGFIGMVLCGALTSAGIGLFAMVQGVLFLMGMSPVVAFPIMTTAGAMQQPLTTLIFLKANKIPLKRTLILSLAGCLGVLIALPIVSHLSATKLHTLLLLIMCFNLIRIGRAFLNSRRTNQHLTPQVAPNANL